MYHKNYSNMISVRKINKSFKNSTFGLRDISFDIESGSVVGLVGFNGAGKTTLLRIISNLLIPDSGKILINNSEKISSTISMIDSNERSMFWRLSVLNNLEFFYDLNLINSNNKFDKINSALNSVGCLHLKNKLFMHLSSGQKQLIKIAKSLVINPKILVFDEATKSLDLNAKTLLYKFFTKYKKDNPDSIILWSTHNLDELDEICDRVLWVDSGTLKRDLLKEAMPNQFSKFILKNI